MADDQSAEVSWTPPRWLIPWITRLQVAIYELSRGRLLSHASGMPHIVIHGVRRKSGTTFAVCLPYWRDDDGHRIVVASFAGAPRNPAWYHNLKDRRANPTARVRDCERVFDVRVDVVDGDEREAIWKRLVADRPFYARYQERTERRIPLLRLVEEGS